ncbi:MAG: NADP-specific glutamate dehydrogenase [Bacteroidales bacterium]
MNVDKIMNNLEKKHPGEVEYLQAVREVLESIEEVYNENPQFESANIIERIIEPDRVIMFKVPWVDDEGNVKVNLGYRIQFNNAIGPYKGGLRFHPSVNLSILKFLGFEQIFKNSLTTLPMGGAKGGSDFDPKGKSNAELMRFCQSFMLQLWKYLGPEVDVPAGDIGVGGREIGFLYGMYKKLKGDHTGVITGKGSNWGGSLIRPEATGFGGIYFAKEMLATRNETLKGKTISISGFGNVAWGAALKATELGGKVVTISGPDGYVYDPDGISGKKIDYMLDLRASNDDIVKPYSYTFEGVEFHEGKRPWEVKVDIALPCATQNELYETGAKLLAKNGCIAVGEGANMPCTPEAADVFMHNKMLFLPGKAANAGGVAVSGLEMAQNSQRIPWTFDKADAELKIIMTTIYKNASEAAKEYGQPGNFILGANIAGFVKVAKAMLAQGLV